MFNYCIDNLLLQSASSFDTAGENFYHGFMLGLCAMLSGAYTTSNRESGEGRYDIQMMPKRANLPGILIELKAEKGCTEEKLKLLSETALQWSIWLIVSWSRALNGSGTICASFMSMALRAVMSME